MKTFFLFIIPAIMMKPFIFFKFRKKDIAKIDFEKPFWGTQKLLSWVFALVCLMVFLLCYLLSIQFQVD